LFKDFNYLLIAVLASVMLLVNLNKPVIREWDEAGYAINALEMLESGNYFVVTHNYLPDLYNSKPPAGLWPMALFIYLFGFNEFSIRLASALAGILCALLLYAFCKKILDKNTALFSSLILISSIGFTGWHEARSGDFDVQVAFCIMLYCFTFWYYLHYNYTPAIIAFFIALTMACLVKGVYGLIAIPAIFFYLFKLKLLGQKVFNTKIFLAFITSIILVSVYYLCRELAAPGYLNAVFKNEVGERIFLETNIHKTHIPFYYHTYKLFWFRFQPYILLLPVAAWYALKNINKPFLMYNLTIIAAIWGVISFSKTKLVWYDGSLYPFMALLVGFYLSKKFINYKKYVLLFLGAIFCITFYIHQTEKDSFDFKYFLSDVRKVQNNSDTITVYATKFNLPIAFYLRTDSINGFKSYQVKEINKINTNLVATINNNDLADIKQKYDAEIIYKKSNCTLLNIRKKLHDKGN